MSSIHNESILEILSKVGVEQHTDISNRTSDNAIADFESKYELTLPVLYRELLQMIDGLSFERDLEFTPVVNPPPTPKGGTIFFCDFFDLKRVFRAIDAFDGQVPLGLIPIGRSTGGDLICMGVDESIYGNIYYWDSGYVSEHNDIHALDNHYYGDNFYLVSHTITDFLHRLVVMADIYQG